jgi:alcohol dehydrogenase, propanol-preferring
MRIIAIDHGSTKEELCRKLGAEEFIDFGTTKDVAAEVKRITGAGAHGVVVTAFTKEAYEVAPSLLRPQGTMVCVGLPHDGTTRPGALPSTLILGQLKIVGSVVGTMKDVDEILDLVVRGLVKVS